MLRFSNRNDFFEMDIAIEEDRSLQSFEDAYVTLKIQSQSFRGQNDLWVLGNELSEFCNGLVLLEQNLKGETKLEAISPNELKVKISSVSSRGNIAVEGSTGYQIQSENSSFWHAVSFGFEFDPKQLSEAVELPWVKRYKSG